MEHTPAAAACALPRRASSAAAQTGMGAREASAAVAALQRRQRRTVNGLMVATTLRWLGVMIRMQTETEIWFRAWPDDLSRQAQVRALVESVCGITAFGLNPLVHRALQSC